ncbi:uncharacterized protein [Miscanthus floridulus]|uniref:uncharacterized protein isoform X4 n=1 Tax=Miscanthus floridulus TaxID=154761 RepID=UPI003458EC23
MTGCPPPLYSTNQELHGYDRRKRYKTKDWRVTQLAHPFVAEHGLRGHISSPRTLTWRLTRTRRKMSSKMCTTLPLGRTHSWREPRFKDTWRHNCQGCPTKQRSDFTSLEVRGQAFSWLLWRR